MTHYEDFKKNTLYALARSGGSMYLSTLLDKCKEDGMDALDFHLHLRQMQDENLARRGSTDDTSSTELSFLIRTPQKRSHVELTSNGWDWVRQHRATDESADAPTSTPSSPEPDE